MRPPRDLQHQDSFITFRGTRTARGAIQQKRGSSSIGGERRLAVGRPLGNVALWDTGQSRGRALNGSKYKSKNGQNTSHLKLVTLCTLTQTQAPTWACAHTHKRACTQLFFHLSSALPFREGTTHCQTINPKSYYFVQSLYDHHNTLDFINTSAVSHHPCILILVSTNITWGNSCINILIL